MKKRYLTIAGLMVGLACLVMAVLALLPPRSGVNKATLDRIEIGTKWEDVLIIFGRGNVRRIALSGPLHFREEGSGGPFVVFGEGGLADVIGDDGTASITFDGNNCVAAKEWIDSPRSIFQKLRQWLYFPAK